MSTLGGEAECRLKAADSKKLPFTSVVLETAMRSKMDVTDRSIAPRKRTLSCNLAECKFDSRACIVTNFDVELAFE